MGHFSWTLTIYLFTLILSTFWVQDIFDDLMQKKLKKLKDKNQLIEGVNFEPMTAKDVACDLVGRTLIIAIFISICNILCLITISPVSNVINVAS